MELGLRNQLFVVTGASSGLGRAVAETLLLEGASVIVTGRRIGLLQEMEAAFPGRAEALQSDIAHDKFPQTLLNKVGNRQISGILINAGGPPAKAAIETTIADWDEAYKTLLRWKVELVLKLIPTLQKSGYGRLLFLESMSVKQPIENLALSTSLRLAVVGFAKSLSQELAHSGITVNVIAPGSHDTKALERIFERKSQDHGISLSDARKLSEQEIPVHRLGRPAEFASLAAWLLSPVSGYVTGQTISADGGAVKGIFG